jgi:hypothetical protein
MQHIVNIILLVSILGFEVKLQVQVVGWKITK